MMAVIYKRGGRIGSGRTFVRRTLLVSPLAGPAWEYCPAYLQRRVRGCMGLLRLAQAQSMRGGTAPGHHNQAEQDVQGQGERQPKFPAQNARDSFD
jgi:hypothetical protein